MKVVWTRNAAASLDSAREFVAAVNPLAATRIAERIKSVTVRLSDHPFLGRPGRMSGTREFFVPGTPFIIIYRTRRDAVQILRVLHERQRWP